VEDTVAQRRGVDGLLGARVPVVHDRCDGGGDEPAKK
jgi:hypothetical protein